MTNPQLTLSQVIANLSDAVDVARTIPLNGAPMQNLYRVSVWVQSLEALMAMDNDGGEEEKRAVDTPPDKE